MLKNIPKYEKTGCPEFFFIVKKTIVSLIPFELTTTLYLFLFFISKFYLNGKFPTFCNNDNDDISRIQWCPLKIGNLDVEYTFAVLSIFDISILTLTFISSIIVDTFLQMIVCSTNCRIHAFVDI